MRQGEQNSRDLMRPWPLLTLLAAACALVFFLASRFDLLDVFYGFTRDHEDWELDEFMIVLAFLAVFFAFYNFSLYRRARAQRKALMQANADLHKALADIKQLKGMIPICANCKSIRDDEGYWRQLESYIRDHTDAEFSHGLCPTCISELYPEIDRPKGRPPHAG